MAEIVLLLQLASTLTMVGVIWFVQIVHYPLFGLVGTGGFDRYEHAHQTRTSRVVAPLMLLEAATAIALVWVRPAGVSPSLPGCGLLFVGLIWLSTYLCQMPAHMRLAQTFDAVTHRRLVDSNWIRTAAWTARGVLVVMMCFQAMYAAKTVAV